MFDPPPSNQSGKWSWGAVRTSAPHTKSISSSRFLRCAVTQPGRLANQCSHFVRLRYLRRASTPTPRVCCYTLSASFQRIISVSPRFCTRYPEHPIAAGKVDAVIDCMFDIQAAIRPSIYETNAQRKVTQFAKTDSWFSTVCIL